MSSPVIVPGTIVRDTLAELKSAGHRKSERVALWLGRRTRDCITIESLWIPEQTAGYDFFDIPRHAMEALFGELKKRRLMVAAQVHTHPGRAFHSHADDKWAIVRHKGALSLVVPYFALRTETDTFVRETALFVLSSANEWLEADPTEVQNYYQICQ